MKKSAKFLILFFIIILLSWNDIKEYWDLSIYNPKNSEYVQEVAFNSNCSIDSVSQEMFNLRYK